jgi:hypothetical protein
VSRRQAVRSRALLGSLWGLSLWALAGCATYAPVPPEPQSIGGRYSVHPQVPWSRREGGVLERWTRHGEQLEIIWFTRGLAEGSPLFGAGRREDAPLPAFRADMAPSEIQEFVLDSLARAGAARVAAQQLRPVRFGDREGLRFELSYLASSGLEMRGLVAACVLERRLYLIAFAAARGHYHAQAAPQVERILESIQLH